MLVFLSGLLFSDNLFMHYSLNLKLSTFRNNQSYLKALICDKPCFCLFSVFADTELKLVSVKEGDSVTLNSGLTEIMDDDVIQWRFWIEDTLIAEINKPADSMTVYDDVLDGRFRDRLKLDKQTGSLTITNFTIEHAGVYTLQMIHVRIYLYLIVYRELKKQCHLFFFFCFNDKLEIN